MISYLKRRHFVVLVELKTVFTDQFFTKVEFFLILVGGIRDIYSSLVVYLAV